MTRLQADHTAARVVGSTWATWIEKGVKHVGVQVLGPANLRALGKGRTWAQAIKDAREKLSTS